MPATRWLLCAVVLLLVGLPGTAAAQAPPGTPRSIAVELQADGVAVSWDAPADDGGDPVYRYTVTASPGGAVVEVPGVARTATVPGLTGGTAYRFTVTALNRAGPGPPSALSDAVTPSTARGPEGREVVREDFATGPGGLAAVEGGTWGVASGRYVLSAPADGGAEVPNANLAVDGTDVTGDFTLTASAATTATDSLFNDFSVVFGYRDPANYWFASFSEGNDADTSGIFRVAGGTRTELADITVPVVAGAVYPIRIERHDRSIWVYRAGERVASVTDPTLQDGRVGFGSRNDGGTFDDLVVTVPGPPPSPPPPPEEPPGFLARVWQWMKSLFGGTPAPQS